MLVMFHILLAKKVDFSAFLSTFYSGKVEQLFDPLPYA